METWANLALKVVPVAIAALVALAERARRRRDAERAADPRAYEPIEPGGGDAAGRFAERATAVSKSVVAPVVLATVVLLFVLGVVDDAGTWVGVAATVAILLVAAVATLRARNREASDPWRGFRDPVDGAAPGADRGRGDP